AERRTFSAGRLSRRHRSTDQSRGAALMRWVPRVVVGLMGVINLVRGAIHAFAPDGGAHSIAGLDLGEDSATILSLFATLGFQQIVLGLFELYAAARAPHWIALFLALQTLTTATALINLYA